MPQKKRKQTNCGSVIPNAPDRTLRERRNKDRHDFVNGVAADPGLNAEPAARDERAHERGNVRAARAERGAAKNREGDSVARPGVRVQDHRDDDDEVAEKNREDRLRPIHAAADERRRQHVSRDAGRHRNPKRGETADAPFAPLLRHRRKIDIVKMALRKIDIDIRRERRRRDRAHLEMRRLALEEFSAAEFADKFPSRAAIFAANGHDVRPAFDLHSFEGIVIEIHLVRLRRDLSAIIRIVNHEVGVAADLNRAFAREQTEKFGGLRARASRQTAGCRSCRLSRRA